METAILSANQDLSVDGIIVYYPVFNNRQDQYLQQVTDVSKDVEGLSFQYIFKLYQNERFLDEQKTQKSLLPCTPLAVLKILDYLRVYNSILPYGNRLFGRSITGDSNLVWHLFYNSAMLNQRQSSTALRLWEGH